MVRFTALSLVGLVAVSLLTLPLAAWIARSIAQREAEDRTRIFAGSVAGPLLDGPFREDPASSTLEMALNTRIQDESVVHVVIWDEDGRVVWSEEPELIGMTEALGPEVQELFRTQGSRSEYASEMHAQGGHPDGIPVLEVYAGGIDADGRPFVLEWYWPTSRLSETQRHILTRTLPLTIGSLAILHLLVMPLTLATARQVEAERRRLTRHALAVQNMERRRLSEDLHDGVVQDLSGIGYALPAVAHSLPPGSAGRPILDQVTRALQHDITSLRALIADIKPPDFSGSGLHEALDALAARTREQGIDTRMTLRGDVATLSHGGRALVYRISREGLRNIVRHARATRADVHIDIGPHAAKVTVRDDGVGLSADREESPVRREHFGLQLLKETVGEVGGDLDLRAMPEGGAELVATFRPDRV
ncbi:MAG: sensor histidine kinase [Dermatophilaceae bacterium]|nr:histidine kinase [Intrasporangiaceae bacterium]